MVAFYKNKSGYNLIRLKYPVIIEYGCVQFSPFWKIVYYIAMSEEIDKNEKGSDGKTDIRSQKLNELLDKVKDNEFIHYLHSGDMGDIIAGMPSALELFDMTGKRAIIHLDISGGMETSLNSKVRKLIENSTMSKGMKFDKKAYEFLRPLLMAQPYIEDVVVFDERDSDKIDVNLNEFRTFSAMRDVNRRLFSNLMYCQQLRCFLVPGFRRPWLTLPPGVSESVELPKNEEGKDRTLAVSRSLRYQSSQILVSSMADMFERIGFFIGTDLEYEAFLEATRVRRDKFPHVKVQDALEIAAIQSRCDSVFSNGTLAYWTAIGQGRKVIHELAASEYLLSTFIPEYKNAMFVRADNIVEFDFKNMARKETPIIDRLNEIAKSGNESKAEEVKKDVPNL